MAFLTTFDLLALHEFSADLPGGWLRRMAACARPVTYQAGDRLCREDETADRLWLIHSGPVILDLHVPGRGDVAVERLGPGSVLGWEALVPPYRWGLGAVAAGIVHGVELPAGGARGFIGEDPELGREICARLLTRVGATLQAARYRLVELCMYPPGEAPARCGIADRQIES